MIKGIYSSGAGMQPRMMRLEVIANNLANIETTGFKKENLFVQVMESAMRGQRMTGSELDGLDVRQFTDFAEGSLRPTGNPLDIAIQGKGFFTVETPQGTRYTRNGNFKLSEDGTIVTGEGYIVQGTNGKIQLQDAQKSDKGTLAITESGEVTVDKVIIGKLKLVQFQNESGLLKEQQTLFIDQNNAQPTEVSEEEGKIRQGFLEESNVDGISEMIAMVELSRGFETDSKSIQYQDATLERVNDVGRL